METSPESREAVAALGAAAALWRRRLDSGWLPPEGSSYPWAQVRLSLAALLPGMANAGAWWEFGRALTPGGYPEVRAPLFSVTLVLAGNTPLMAWSPLCAALLAGAARVRVKMSRDETLWPRLFVEALAEVAPGVAGRVERYDFPGEDPRTAALLADADAVIAYGSDETVAALRAVAPEGARFFGFGHAVSVGLVHGEAEVEAAAAGFARDVLMFDQQGCLSPQGIFTAQSATGDMAAALARALKAEAVRLEVPPVSDPAVASAVRRARDMALFAGFQVVGDPALRWTVAHCVESRDLPEPVGHGFVYVLPLKEPAEPADLCRRFGWARGRISGVGVAGEVSGDLREALEREGVSRLCRPGEMQTPPLDWPNGGIDLLAELLRANG